MKRADLENILKLGKDDQEFVVNKISERRRNLLMKYLNDFSNKKENEKLLNDP